MTAARGSNGPLDGLLVVDLSRVLSGPFCTMQLADMGARVIKIEQPGRGDDTRAWGPPFIGTESAYYLSINRNKESCTLDLKQPAGRDILERLLDRADVLVENFRPGTMERLGLDFESVSADRPRLIYCSISGFGQTGPRRGQSGYDAVMQAEAGLMSVTGDADGPPFRLGLPIADLATGLYATQGITLALLARASSGRGQRIDVAMLDATAALLTYHASIYFGTGRSSQRMGNRHPTIVPYETFAAADGELVVSVGNDEQWRRFCDVIGDATLAADARFATNQTRVAHYDALRPTLVARLAERRRAEWMAAFTDAGIPCGLVRDIAATLEDPQLSAREMIATVEHVTEGAMRLLGVPVKMSATPGAVRTAPPTLGQHTEPILRDDLGLTLEAIASLRAARVV